MKSIILLLFLMPLFKTQIYNLETISHVNGIEFIDGTFVNPVASEFPPFMFTYTSTTKRFDVAH